MEWRFLTTSGYERRIFLSVNHGVYLFNDASFKSQVIEQVYHAIHAQTSFLIVSNYLVVVPIESVLALCVLVCSAVRM